MKVDPRSLDTELYGRGFSVGDSDRSFHLLAEMPKALWRARYWLAMAVFLGGLIAAIISLGLERKYTAVSRVMIDTRSSAEAPLSSSVAGLPVSAIVIESELEVMRSYDLVERVIDRLDLANDPEFQPSEPSFLSPGVLISSVKSAIKALAGMVGIASPPPPGSEELAAMVAREQLVRSVAANVSVSQVGNLSAVFAVYYTSLDGQKSAAIANAFAEEYIAKQTEEKVKALDLATGWLSDRTVEMNVNLAELNAELESNAYRAPYSSDSEVENARRLRATTEIRLRSARSTEATLSAEIATVEDLLGQGKPLEAARAIGEPSPSLRTAITAGNNDAALERRLDADLRQLKARLSQATSNASELDRSMAALTEKLDAQAQFESESRRLENEIHATETVYENFLSQLSVRQSQDAILQPDARIIARARPALEPSRPNRTRFALAGAFLAGALAAGFIIFRELFQTKLRTFNDYESATGLQVLGMMPFSAARSETLRRVIGGGPPTDDATLKWARKLRANLETIRPEPQNQIITMVSAMQSEGKSTSVVLLGQVYANAGLRTLIIDCDFWRTPFGQRAMPDTPSLEMVVDDPALFDQAVHVIENSKLEILPATGKIDDPARFLSSGKLQRYLTTLKGRYDRIIIDMPPVLPMVDVVSLARVADSVLFLARWNGVSKGAVRSALRILKDVGVQPVGVVATLVDADKAKDYSDDAFAYMLESYKYSYGN